MAYSDLISLGITALSGFGGIAVGYGYMKSKIEALEKGHEDHAKKIHALEARGLNIVFKEDCLHTRDECHRAFCRKVDELKHMVLENREAVVEKFSEISEFIGFVKANLGTSK